MGSNPEPIGVAGVNSLIINKITVIRLARKQYKQSWALTNTPTTSPAGPAEAANPNYLFPAGLTTLRTDHLGVAVGAAVLALVSTGVFSEDYLVDNSHTKSKLLAGGIGTRLQKILDGVAKEGAPLSKPTTLDANELATKMRSVAKGTTQKDQLQPQLFLGIFMDLLQKDQYDTATLHLMLEAEEELVVSPQGGTPMGEHFDTSWIRWTSCLGCQKAWEDDTRYTWHMELCVPMAPEVGATTKLTALLAEWTIGIQRRGEVCALCNMRSAMSDKRLLTSIQNVLCFVLNRKPKRQEPKHNAVRTTRTPVDLPVRNLDMGPFFHPDYHHEKGTQLFQLTAIICFDEGCPSVGKDYRMCRFVTFAEHPGSGAWFRHDAGRVTPVVVGEALMSDEVRMGCVAVFYRRHEPSSAHYEDHSAPTQADPLTDEGRFRADIPRGVLQQSLLPATRLTYVMEKTGVSGTQAQALALRSAKKLKEENKGRVSSAEKRARKTATPPKQKKPPGAAPEPSSPQTPVALPQPVVRPSFTVFKGVQ